MLNLATISANKNLLFGVKSQKIEKNVFFSVSHIDNICPPLSSPIVNFNIEGYGEKYQNRLSVPIDTML